VVISRAFGKAFFAVALFALCWAAPSIARAAPKLPWCGISNTATAAAQGELPALQSSASAEALYRLGLAYAVGNAVDKSCASSLADIRRAAVLGYAPAQNALGELYEAGEVKSADYVEATRWYRLAADAENARAQYNLGRMIADGHASPEAAKTIANVSANQSAVEPPIWNAGMQAHSAGRERYAAAASLWQKSADSGDHLAQYRLGGLYASGLGVPYDLSRAEQLYRQAAPFVPEAQKALDQLEHQ
jgi:TPR repeat protein